LKLPLLSPDERPRFDIPSLAKEKIFSRPFSKQTLWILSMILSFVFAYGLLSRTSNAMASISIQSQWKESERQSYNENSNYGNITVTKSGEQFTFFTNAVPTIPPCAGYGSIEISFTFPCLS